jgi:hypothetical protein
MKTKTFTQDEIVSKVAKILDKIILENTQSLFQGDYLVRPNYGYQKFYLNWTSGSYDMSINSLVHYILAEENIYKQILNEDQFAKCMKVIEDEPEAIYNPECDSDEDLEVQDLLDTIYYKSISYTGKKLIAMGLNVSHDFKDYLNDSDHQIPEEC